VGWFSRGHEAVGALTAAVALKPDNASVRVLLGFKIYRLDRYDDAIAVWHDALRVDPSYGYAKAWIADALWRRGDQKGARAAWEDAIRRSPQDQKIYINRERAVSSVDPAQAIRDYRAALDIVDIPYTRYSLADLLANTKDKSLQDRDAAFQEAEAALQRAKRSSDKGTEGSCYILLLLTDRARAIQKHDAELHTQDSASVRYRLAYVLACTPNETLRDLPRAIRESGAVIRLAERSGDKELELRAHQLRAYARQPSDPAQAIEDLRRALRIRESAYSARFGLVNLLANAKDEKHRDPQAAVREAKVGLRLAQEAGAADEEKRMRLALGYAQYRAGEYAEALTGFKSAQEAKRGNPIIVASFRAMAHWQLGQKEEARTWLAKANELADAGFSDAQGYVGARLEEARGLMK